MVDEFLASITNSITTKNSYRVYSDSIAPTSARSLMDRASDYGSEGWKFESSRARQISCDEVVR